MCKALSGPPQIFILLQYQTLAHRIKTNVLRADNLDNLNRTSAAAGKKKTRVEIIDPDVTSMEALYPLAWEDLTFVLRGQREK